MVFSIETILLETCLHDSAICPYKVLQQLALRLLSNLTAPTKDLLCKSLIDLYHTI